MSKRITNGFGLRREMEAKGIALLSSGSYVRRSFDPDEFAHVQTLDFSKMQFSDEDFVVVAHGPQGTLAKFARVTKDRRFARYFGRKYISVALIEGEVFSQREFVRSIANNPTLRVAHVSTAKEYTGVLHGDISATYKSLVYAASSGFLLLDIEENPPPQATHMKVSILATNPPEGLAAKEELTKHFG
ncbi:MAG TPA: hypothetical protein VGW37_11350 [Terriglobia bacterium]|nr:hypothetical protein [Terriglobia bacterium]